jgi:hypothetical protein
MGRNKSELTLQIIAATRDLLDEYPDSLWTVRNVLYSLLSNTNLLESTKDYDKLSRIITAARIAGELDDDRFVDNRRAFHPSCGWDSFEEYMRAVRGLTITLGLISLRYQ